MYTKIVISVHYYIFKSIIAVKIIFDNTILKFISTHPGVSTGTLENKE